ncbi:MAG: hypothetical protein Q8941_17615 [Bacteroidota bacterium]|nr:hypothetical protein [Bacteroidota bacterium]
MANYLLLRNNKESGPYTLDDLVGLGLKPYDLVWVQGKSAAWRYPSEVEELKAFAPVVEEQPFDRFFKKQDDEKKQVPVVAAEHEKYIPKKSVYVNMPGQKNNPVKQPVKEEILPITPVQPTISVSENPVTAEVKYSQPLDEIKEMYVKTLHDRKQRIARKGFWMQSLKKAAILLLLVAIGVVAGFVLKSNNNNSNRGNKGEATVQKAAESQPVKSMSPLVEKDTGTQVQNDIKVIAPPQGGYVNKEVLEERNSAALKQSANASVKKEPLSTPAGNETRNSLVAKGVEINPATGERDRKVRSLDEETSTGTSKNTTSKEVKQVSANELYSQVSVASNEYKKVAFGGIRDLQLTVTNDSKYILDNVTVELQYLKPSEQTLRTENIQFTSIGPKATSTIRVPDTNRGIKVIYRIVSIKKHPGDGDVAGN